MPKVSVILTSYNHEHYLREAIDSTLGQTFSDFELIIWDDASCDGSWQIINSYDDLRIMAYQNQHNMRGGNVNRALAIASGEYIAIHHSDDVWEPHKLAKQVAYLDAHPDIGAVFTHVQPINEEGTPLTDENHFYYKIFDQPNRTRHEWLRFFFIHGNALCHPSVMMRRTCFNNCGLYRFGLAQLNDFDMWVRLALRYELYILPEKLTKFRVRDNEANTSGKSPETQARFHYEFYKLLSNFLKISSNDELCKIFPEANQYLRGVNVDVTYALARVALDLKPFRSTECFGLDILFDLIQDPERARKLETLYGFNYKDFIALTGKHDALSIYALLEREGQIANLRDEADRIVIEKDSEIHNLQQQLNQILDSFSWRITVPLRKMTMPIRQDFGAPFMSFLRKIAEYLRIRGDLKVLLKSRVRAFNVAAFDAEVESIRQSGLFNESFYLSMYPDLQPAPHDSIRHYCEHGWREGRNPSADFDTNFYLATYSDIRDAGINPFWHYIVAGAAELRYPHPDAEVGAIKKSGLFNESFYLSMYPDLQPAPHDPIRHYCEHGWHEGRNPSVDFDTSCYLSTYSDVRNMGINPFWHYIVAGASEMRHALPDLAIRYENDVWFGNVDTDIKLLAFYASPDWATLRSRQLMFKGHSHPPLPLDEFGFYDPSDGRTLKQQAELAKRHGLYGFCFDLSTGAKGAALSQPVEVFLAHDDIDFPFCVQAELGSEDMLESLVALLVRAVSDKRFIHINDRPVILVTMTGETQHAASAVRRLRERLADRDISSPFLIGRWSSAGEELYDAVLDLSSTPVPGETGAFLPLDQNGVDTVPYSVVAAQGVARTRMEHGSACPLYHTVVLGRDNTAQSPERPLVYTRFDLKEYRRWLDAALADARAAHPADHRFVFVNGWNDWNEGLFLEPDRQVGFGRVNETTRALLGIAQGAVMPKVSVIVPNYNHERFLRRRLNSIYGQTYKNIEVILLDDCSSDRSRSILDQYAADNAEITRTLYNDENSGSAFRQWAKGIKTATGDLVWIAESDDYCDEDFLEVLVRCFEDEAVLLAYAQSTFVDKNEVSVRFGFQSYLNDLGCVEKWNDSYVETAHNEVSKALGIKNTIPNASSVLFRRPINMPLLDDESWLSMVVAGDWVFYLHIMQGGRIAYSTATTNFFRRYEGSAAEVTYKKEVFYREVGRASRTVAALYQVPLAVLEQSRRIYQTAYENAVGGSDEEFARWYDYESILQARERRLPNVMVSTMGFFPGGAEILPLRLANEFKRQGLSVLLLNAGFHRREDGVRRMLRNDVPVIETSSVEEMKAIIHDFGVEALNTHQWHIQKYPNQVPDVFDELRVHVASLHGMIEHGDTFGVTEEHLRKADQGVTTWVYTAEKNLVPFADVGLYDKSSSKFVKMANGMQPPDVVPVPRAYMGIPEDAFALCCVSRAIPDKGWAEMILVIERARALSGRDIRLMLVGNGTVYDEYCRLGVPDFVYLAGFSENSVGHYASADMGIMLTKFKSESFPLTIVDCLFAGKPYIATDVGDIRNMLTTSDDVAGEVIELEDWEVPIERTAQVVAAFATDRQKYRNALTLVKDVANRYHIDVVASQYVRLFDHGRDEERLRSSGSCI